MSSNAIMDDIKRMSDVNDPGSMLSNIVCHLISYTAQWRHARHSNTITLSAAATTAAADFMSCTPCYAVWFLHHELTPTSLLILLLLLLLLGRSHRRMSQGAWGGLQTPPQTRAKPLFFGQKPADKNEKNVSIKRKKPNSFCLAR